MNIQNLSIYVDADACPVITEIIQCAKEYQLPVILLCDSNHMLRYDYARVVIISDGPDAVDYALINMLKPGDVVVTQDYGVAAMSLGKGCWCMHQNGMRYTNDNIERLLMERHMARKERMAHHKHHIHGPAKRTTEDNKRFDKQFRSLISEIVDQSYT